MLKVYELKLPRGKNKKKLAGINAMSIVSEPAILIEFLKLSNEVNSDDRKIVPVELHSKIIDHLKDVGETRESLEAAGYILIATDNVVNEEGKKILKLAVESSPDEDSAFDTGDYAFRFRYDGPQDSKNRDFCSEVIGLDLLYRKEDINQMSFRGENGDFGTYSIWNYKGSYNCRHRWIMETYLKTNGEEIPTGSVPSAALPKVNPKGLTVNPKVGLSKQTEINFAVDKDEQVVTGPALIPNLKIFRNAESLGTEEDGYVFFSERVVKELSEMFMTDENMNNITLDHDHDTKDVKLIESWLVNNPEKDKANELGFNVPKGTWMVSYKIEDNELWNRIKNDEFNGFSIEASNLDRKEIMMNDELNTKLKEIAKTIVTMFIDNENVSNV